MPRLALEVAQFLWLPFPVLLLFTGLAQDQKLQFLLCGSDQLSQSGAVHEYCGWNATVEQCHLYPAPE